MADDAVLDLEFISELPAELRTVEEDDAYVEAYPVVEASHDQNLAEVLEDKVLGKLALDVINNFEQDEASRKDWLYRERHGIRLLGISENVVESASFEGASQVTYPGLIEAVVQFQSRALAELWPPEGPVKVLPLSKVNKDHDYQSYRVQRYMNYLYTEEMPGAFEEQDKMLFRLALSGSAFVKNCYDPLEGTIVRKYIATDDFVVPYTASDLRTTPRWTHVLRYIEVDLQRLMRDGFYRHYDNLRMTTDDHTGQDRTLKDEVDATESRDKSTAYDDKGPNLVYEQMCYLTIEDEDDIARPYIVHVDKANQKVLAIYRNWEENDEKYRPTQHITHYKFLPGLGFYGYGYLHMLSGIAHSQTGGLRALMDSAQFANMQGGFMSDTVKMDEDEIPIAPGEWRRTQALAEELQKAFFPLPFKEPSGTLFNLVQFLDEVFRRTAGTTEVVVGDAPNNAPVGTTLALIEQSQRVQSAVHIRLHQAARHEYRIVQKLINKWFDALNSTEGSYVELVDPELTADDFDGRVDVIPVSDPNVISSAQRIAMAQAVLQLSEQAPELYNKAGVHRRLLEAMRVYDLDDVLLDTDSIPQRDPLSENMAIMNNTPVKAYIDQDHDAHIMVLDSWFNTTDAETRRQREGEYWAHRAEHVAYKYQIQMMQMMGIDGLPEDLTPEEQALITSLSAQASQQMLANVPEEPDPASQETQAKIQLKAQESIASIERKNLETAEKIRRENLKLASDMQLDEAEVEQKILSKAVEEEARDARELV